MVQHNSEQPRISRETMNLWPEAGKRIGMGRNATYETAAAGQFPGAVKLGGRWFVMRKAFEDFLRTGAKNAAA